MIIKVIGIMIVIEIAVPIVVIEVNMVSHYWH
jgi:hypothetical protein